MVEEVAGLFLSTTEEVDGDGLESSASLDAALTAAAPADIKVNQRTNGPVNAHLISWPSKAQNIQNLKNIW